MFCLNCRKRTEGKYCLRCDPTIRKIAYIILGIILLVAVVALVYTQPQVVPDNTTEEPDETNTTENITVPAGPEPTPEFVGECDLRTREILRRDCINACNEFSNVAALKCGDLAYDLECEGLYQVAFQCSCLSDSDNCESDLVQERICKTDEPCW